MSESWSQGVGLLLSLEQRKAGVSSLLATVLASRNCWAEKSAELSAVVNTHLEQGRNLEALLLLTGLIKYCSVSELTHCYQNWSAILLQCLKGCMQVTLLQQSCKGFSALIKRLQDLPDLAKHFSSEQLAGLLRSLLWFSGSSSALQCTVLPLLSQCVAAFHSACSQHSSAIKEWAEGALFTDDESLSQECSRLLVLLSSGSAEQWSALVGSLNTALEWTLTCLYKPVLREDDCQEPQFPLPSVPATEPHSSAVLLRCVVVLSRTLSHCFIFPPHKVASVPLPVVLATIFLGLSVQSRNISAQLTEQLLLSAMLPAVHTAVWELFGAFVKCCGNHLLLYCAHIEACIVRGIVCDPLACPAKTLALHKAVSTWVQLRGDAEMTLLTPVVRTLMKSSQQTQSIQVQFSSLDTLCDIIRVVGPVIPAALAHPVSQLPYEVLGTAPLPALKLLVASVSSANGRLASSLNQALQCLIQHSSHPHREVRDYCHRALAQCGMFQRPVVVAHTVQENIHDANMITAVYQPSQWWAATSTEATAVAASSRLFDRSTTSPVTEMTSVAMETESAVMETDDIAMEMIEPQNVVAPEFPLRPDSIPEQHNTLDDDSMKVLDQESSKLSNEDSLIEGNEEEDAPVIKANSGEEDAPVIKANSEEEDAPVIKVKSGRSHALSVIEVYDSSDDELLGVLDPSSPDKP